MFTHVCFVDKSPLGELFFPINPRYCMTLKIREFSPLEVVVLRENVRCADHF